ncbi:MAG: hypothetical protein JWR21_3374 [Herminiimonas sp.]|nr:hypothetical protein [Herminiimonas sp.]
MDNGLFNFGGNIGSLVQMAIAPAFLFVALGSVLRVLNNRLTRLTNRLRSLEEKLAQPRGTEGAPVDQEFIKQELLDLYGSRRALYRAITLAAAAALLTCLLILTIFVDDLVNIDLVQTTALLFVTAIACLVGSLLLFLREIVLSSRRLYIVIRRRIAPSIP